MPSAAQLSDTLGAPVQDWPLAFEQQLKAAEGEPCVLLVRGDPLVATPHRHLVDALKTAGKRVMIRRRLGIAELAAEFAPQKPRVLAASANEKIQRHLEEETNSLLVVTDDTEQDLSRYLHPDWSHLWLSHLGSKQAFIGRHQPSSDLLCLLFTVRQH